MEKIRLEQEQTKNVCRVTFIFPREAAPDAKSVSIVGDFNNWNIHANPMKKVVVVVRIEEAMPNAMSGIITGYI